MTAAQLTVAAVHVAPVLLDRAACVAKAVDAISAAGSSGVRLLGFPETFLPGYPYWLAITPCRLLAQRWRVCAL